jgi:hypothetical protein
MPEGSPPTPKGRTPLGDEFLHGARRGLRPGRISAPVARFILLTLGGIGLVCAFESEAYLPATVSIALLFLLTGWGLWKIRLSPLTPLTRLMILLYFLPFSACGGYLFDSDFTWWNTELSMRYMRDSVILDGMTMVGLIGLVGLLAGLCLAHARAPQDFGVPRSAGRSGISINFIPFCFLLLLALFFSYISTPDDTIYSDVYSAKGGLAAKFNFNGAYLIAYTILIALYVDSEEEESRKVRTVKRLAILGVTVFILVFFQLLRGDRDSFGLVVGLAGLHLTEPSIWTSAKDKAERIRRYLTIGCMGLTVLAAFLAIASFRFVATDSRERLVLSDAIIEGATTSSTWTSVLLTNLSLASQYHLGVMTTEDGLTYLDYFYSLPPGFITKALDIERPIEPDRGPNFWFTDLSSGGVHVVTVPFKNFLSPGALLILLLIGYFIGRSELMGQRPRWVSRLWYGSFFVGSAHWFWYGDIVFIREIMSFSLVALLFALIRSLTQLRLSAPPRHPNPENSPP